MNIRFNHSNFDFSPGKIRETTFLYEFQFKEHDKGFFLSQEFLEWLSNNLKGECLFIKEHGALWGISFELEEDALLFRLRWQ